MATVVIFYPDKVIPALNPSARLSFDAVELQAGTNALPPDQLEALQKHPDFSRYQSLKAIELVSESEEVDPNANAEIVDLGIYDADQAVKIVNSTNDLAVLDAWLKTETRKTIRSAIATRINQLKSGLI